jgi:hypothetical protein
MQTTLLIKAGHQMPLGAIFLTIKSLWLYHLSRLSSNEIKQG